MSEFNPFRTGDDADQATDQVEQVQAEEAGGKRNLVIALGGVAGLVLAGGGFFFLSGDDAAEEFEPVKRAPRAEAAAPAAAPEAKKLPAQARIALGRNPFRALYVEPAPAPPPPAPADPGAAGDGVTTPVIISAPIGSGPAPAPGAGSGTDAAAPQQPTAKEHKLVLLRVFGEGKDQSASFSIDGKQQTAKVGTTFGPSAEILLLSLQQGPKDDQWTAVLQVGDGDPFDVVTGEPVFVR